MSIDETIYKLRLFFGLANLLASVLLIFPSLPMRNSQISSWETILDVLSNFKYCFNEKNGPSLKGTRSSFI